MSETRFEISTAALSGLEYINTHRKRVMIWSALLLGPVIIFGGISIFLVVLMMAASQSLGENPGSGSVDLVSGILSLLALPLITSVGATILGKTRQGEWHGIRLGKDEGLMLGVLCLLVAASIGVVLGASLVVGLFFGLGYLIAGVTGGLWFAIPSGIVACLALVWASLRASLIFAASLDMGRLAFIEGWKATKGQVWRLLGTALLASLVSLVVAIVVIVGVAIVGGIIGGLGFAAYSAGGWLAASPFIVIGALVAAVVFTASWLVNYIIGYAPYFHIWRALKGDAVASNG